MPWRYLDDRAIADVAFSATGGTLEELFRDAVDALVNAMVADLSTVIPRESKTVSLAAESVEMLLFELLQSVIFAKDADGMLLRIDTLRITERGAPASKSATLSATLRGERIDPRRHELQADVKAVTLYRYRVEAVQDGWEAEIVLDV